MNARRARYQFGGASRVSAEAIGEPGKRTFRLSVSSGQATATLWLEKEQLYQLAIFIQETIASLNAAEPRKGKPGELYREQEWTGPPTSVEFKVDKLALGYDPSRDAFLFIAHDDEEEEGGPAALTFWTSREQAEGLADESLKACAAGRPLCPLCHQPMGPDGHVCPRSNGHGAIQA
ncbi:MAG: DUF3090 family protein [Chloroflexota bacterium]|nr:DUF3090 family protein [Chloroflexota bacterium]